MPRVPPIPAILTLAARQCRPGAPQLAADQLRDRLASLPWLTNVTLLSTANGGTGTTLSRGDTFSVTAGFNPNGGAK